MFSIPELKHEEPHSTTEWTDDILSCNYLHNLFLASTIQGFLQYLMLILPSSYKSTHKTQAEPVYTTDLSYIPGIVFGIT